MEFKPRMIAPQVAAIAAENPGEWHGPEQIWERLQQCFPGVTQQVLDRIDEYKDPDRNNPHWFVALSFYALEDDSELEISDVKDHPEIDAYWMIIRKVN